MAQPLAHEVIDMLMGLAPSPVPDFAKSMITMPWLVGTFVMKWAAHENHLSLLISVLEGSEYQAVRDELLDGQQSDYEKRLRYSIGKVDSGLSLYMETIQKVHLELRPFRHNIVHGWFSGLNEEGDYVLRRKIRKQPRHTEVITRQMLSQKIDALDRLERWVTDAIQVSRGMPPVHRVLDSDASGAQ